MDGVVEVQGGRVRGVRRRGLWSYSGIPYAASPEGPGRWRPPAPPEPWTGIRDCKSFGPIAPQSPGVLEMSLGGEPEEHSEDCLSLNVWTPGLEGGRRPVMVWVHGGSFVSGSGAGSLYRGGMLAREGDVVVVTFNYRLGMLGFLAHPALEDEGQTWLHDDEWSGFGNWGLADQVAVLRWVRDHIAGFGGDPGNVTLFGESAGGMSVAALLAVPAARGLFHRAVVESGPPNVHSAEQASKRAEELVDHLGVPMTREALERVPVEELVRAAADLGLQATRDLSGLLVMPVVDGGLLSAPPDVEVASGSASGVPLLVGTTRDEAGFFAAGNPKLSTLDDEGLRRWVMRFVPEPDATDTLIAAVREARLGRGEAATPRDLWVAISTDALFRMPTVRLADAHAAAADPGVGTYCYLFTWESPAFGGVLGSCHALEIPFVFGSVHNPGVQGFSGGGEEAFALSAAMRRAWVAFARSGAPQGWPAWDPESRPTKVFGPWPGSAGMAHEVERPRDEELGALEPIVSLVVTR
ncbi:MAG TPA: carboxylesterase family protein [Acidimicrobiales bacterium]|nr:carboxylesterase family protein [Acidimicrobiales bacterium]